MAASKHQSHVYVVESSSASSTLDERETQHLINRRRLDLVRAGVSGLALALAVVVIGTAAHATNVYAQTSIAGQYYLPLWPGRISNRPAVALVASASIIALLNAFYLAVTFFRGYAFDASS